MKNRDLSHLASAARDLDPVFDDARAARVLSAALDRRERRAARDRLFRRAAVIGSAAAVIGFVFLKGASASPNASASDLEAVPAIAAAATDTLNDAGYGRD